MGNDLVPSDDRIGRDALERIILRAAELQSRQREMGENLTEREVLELGEEVGIPARHLQQALLEERTRVLVQDSGVIARISGPKRLSAERTVPGILSDIDRALTHWMTEVELLSIKRRYPDGTSWEPRKDWVAALKRGVGVGGRKYVLTRTKDILGKVQTLEDGWCHVALVADASTNRMERVGGGAAFLGVGGAMTTVAVVLGVATGVALIPVAVGIAGGFGIARSHRKHAEQIQVALEQVLDRLERKEIEVPTATRKPQGGDFVKKLTAEIKEIGKQFGK